MPFLKLEQMISDGQIDAKVTTPAVVAVCCLAIIAALVLGVGLASHLVLRHVVQTLPLWAGVAAGFRRLRTTGWIALPSFVFWLCIMVLIWLYLLGIAKIVSGHFSTMEITMTLIVGAASLVGIMSFAKLKSSLSGTAIVGIVCVMAVLQLL